MHNYLRAIGFNDYFESEYELDLFLDELFHTYQQKKAVHDEDKKETFLELSKSFGPNMGIRVCGEMDDNGFHRRYYYPYLTGTGATTDADLTMEKKVNGECFAGMCEDARLGISLIFFLQNPADVRKEAAANYLKGNKITTTLSGLAAGGMILLPKKEVRTGQDGQTEYYRKHEKLVSAARNGNQEAIESLTLEDMDTYAMISRRIIHEDILTIVDSYIMPYGIECDQYQVLGTILFFTKVYNSLTREAIYQMTIDCNGLQFDICINAADLLGEPETGRRFKGNVWLQGRVNFK